jgi:hypothetical protein
VADHTSGILEDLVAAIRTVNEVIDQTQLSPNVGIRALRDLCAALQQVVDHDDLWQALYESTSGEPSFASGPNAKAFLEPVADVLCNAHAALLLRCGYRSPPPPRAHDLIEQTRNSVLAEDRDPRWGAEHIECAREALTNFVQNVVKHINDANPVMLRRISNRIRQATIGAAFMALLSQAEIKTGDGFSVEFSASLTDPIVIEITVPAPWAAGPMVESMDSIATITSVDNLTQMMDLPFDDPARLDLTRFDPDPAKTPDLFEDLDPFEDPGGL